MSLATYTAKNQQNIYDVSMAIYGSIEGIYDLLVNNEDLSLDGGVNAGDVLNYNTDNVVNSDIVDYFTNNSIVPKNSERSSYYKDTGSLEIKMMFSILPGYTDVYLSMSGSGTVVIDWGDNSDLQTINLVSGNTPVKYPHYFDDETDERKIFVYGDFSFDTLDLSGISGMMYLFSHITVRKFYCSNNNISFGGLFLFDNTNNVELSNADISTLLPIKDMQLSNLKLIGFNYSDNSYIDEYLIYVAGNYGERPYCNVTMDCIPSGTYQEPQKDVNGNYIISSGMGAIWVITHEESWNTPSHWIFKIYNSNSSFVEYEYGK